jgi:hypothetical protein
MMETNEMTPLGYRILEHWKRYRPNMVRSLEQANHLQKAIFAAQELTTDLIYELAVVQKMEYQPAWEIATREWAFLPDETEQPQLSFDPANLSPHKHSPATSASPTFTA